MRMEDCCTCPACSYQKPIAKKKAPKKAKSGGLQMLSLADMQIVLATSKDSLEFINQM